MPKFQELDKKQAQAGYVKTEELQELYTNIVGGLADHHMTFRVRNLYPAPDDESYVVSVTPSDMEIPTRDYYFESSGEENHNIQIFLQNIDNQYTVETHKSCVAYVSELGKTITYHYILFRLPDGRKIPYLWQSSAGITPVMQQESEGAQLLDHYFRAITETPRGQLAGIILDNRCNRGGYQDDLDYLVGTYLNERVEIFKTRYKEGPGRLEHSPWTSYYQSPIERYHRDITAENIPYVILCDINSVSMGEIEPMIIKAVLPTAAPARCSQPTASISITAARSAPRIFPLAITSIPPHSRHRSAVMCGKASGTPQTRLSYAKTIAATSARSWMQPSNIFNVIKP